MNNVIEVDFSQEFRKQTVFSIKSLGISRTREILLSFQYNPTFVSVLIKSIISKEGW